MNDSTTETRFSPINRVIAAPKNGMGPFVSDAAVRTDQYFCSRLNVAPVSGTSKQPNGQGQSFTVDAGPRTLAKSRALAADYSAVAAPQSVGPATVVTVNAGPAGQANGALAGDGLPRVAGLTMAQLEKLAITQTLERCAGNRTRAARMLGVSVRTLQRKLSSWKLKCV
jgi:hypothetical protein